MPESSNEDHWGALASNLGAQPQDEETPDNPDQTDLDDQTEPEYVVDDAGELASGEEEPDEPVSACASGDDDLPIPPQDHEPSVTLDDEPPIVADALTTPVIESDDPPIPDFLEAVRREAERSESVENAAWPVVPSDMEIEPAHDAGESIRNSPEQPLDLVADEDVDPSEELEASDESAEDSADAASQSEEKSGRRRRRRRGRRGGKSRRGESEGQPSDEESDVAGDAPSDSPHLDQEDAVVEEEGDEVTAHASEGSDRPKHRNIPTWPEAIGMIVDSNLESRSKSPSAERGRGRGRGRGGRRRGKSGSKEKK